MVFYAFTLRKTNIKKAPATAEAYEQHIKRIFLDHGVEVTDYGYEHEAGLHVHGVLALSKPMGRKPNYMTVRGWHLHVTPCRDLVNWMRYYRQSPIKTKIEGEYEPTEDDMIDLATYHEEYIKPVLYRMF